MECIGVGRPAVAAAGPSEHMLSESLDSRSYEIISFNLTNNKVMYLDFSILVQRYYLLLDTCNYRARTHNVLIVREAGRRSGSNNFRSGINHNLPAYRCDAVFIIKE